MLPSDHLVTAQIRNVGDTGFTTRLDDHPADVTPKEALVSRVGIEVGICVSVMGPMTTSPPSDAAFDGTGAAEGEEVLKG